MESIAEGKEEDIDEAWPDSRECEECKNNLKEVITMLYELQNAYIKLKGEYLDAIEKQHLSTKAGHVNEYQAALEAAHVVENYRRNVMQRVQAAAAARAAPVPRQSDLVSPPAPPPPAQAQAGNPFARGGEFDKKTGQDVAEAAKKKEHPRGGGGGKKKSKKAKKTKRRKTNKKTNTKKRHNKKSRTHKKHKVHKRQKLHKKYKTRRQR